MLGLRLGLGLPFVFIMCLQSLLHFPHALLSRYRRWMNKVSDWKIYRWFCSHCLVTWLLRLRHIIRARPHPPPGQVVPCYLRAGRAAKVLARAISTA